MSSKRKKNGFFFATHHILFLHAIIIRIHLFIAN